MKGKATLTLCDAASGRVVKQIEEHNMVTNALSSIFQPPKLAMFGGLNFATALDGFLPMSKSLIGGIVLLGENVEENASDFMLKPAATVVGHAGAAYSGTEETRGTLNENESYATENGYHFTWDFPTDKANGVIRCCALTNKHFGNIGRAYTNADGSLLVNPSAPTNAATSVTGSLTTQTGCFVGMYEEGILTFFRFVDDDLVRTKVKLIDPESILINDALGGTVIEEATIYAPFVPKNIYNYFVDSASRLVYFFESSINQGTTQVTYYGVDPLTGDVPVYNIMSIEGSYTLQYSAVFGNRLYQAANSKINVFTISGYALKTYDFVTDKFFVYGGTLCAEGKKDGVRCIMCFNEDGTVTMRNNLYIPVESSLIPLPYTLHTKGEPTTNSAHIMMFTNYLATINNLAQPLEKTSAQTLKVTYDITNT